MAAEYLEGRDTRRVRRPKYGPIASTIFRDKFDQLKV